jgi:hypothetical protein
MKRWTYTFLLIGLLGILFGFSSCYQAYHDKTPQMYPGSEGSDGKALLVLSDL